MANKANKKLVESNKQFLTIHAQVLAGIWLFYFIFRVLIFSSSMDTWQWVMLVLSTGVEAGVMYQFYTIGMPTYGPAGELLDGGHDLNQQGGLVDYMRDALYISMACQGLAVLTDYAWYLFWLVPGIGAYKLWTSLIGPMMAAKS